MWLLWTDLHLDNYRAFATVTPSGLNSRLATQADVVKQVKQVARRNKVTNIFFLGDLFNSLAPSVHKMIYNVAFYLIQSLSEIAPIYLIVGNHDIYGKIHLFTPFTTIPNVHIIADSTSKIIDGKSVDLIPWGGPLFGEDKAEYCFGHFAIQSARAGSWEVPENTAVPLKLLQDYRLCLAGHIHTQQKIANNVYHIGAVMQNSFKDAEGQRGVWLVEPKTGSHTFVPIKSPQFVTLTVSADAPLDVTRITPHDYYRILVQSDNVTLPDLGPNVVVEYDFEPQSGVEDAVNMDEIHSFVPIITQFIDNSNTALPKEVLKQKAIELLEA